MNLKHNAILLPKTEAQLVLNITCRVYGFAVRNGDMIGFCNIIEHLRQREQKANIKLWIEENAIFDKPFCHQFHRFLKENTDYFSENQGAIDLPMYDMWLYRMAAGDYVKIKNKMKSRRKICIFPVFDASYNTFRNWPIQAAQCVIDHYSQPEFQHYEKFFCGIVIPSEINYRDFIISHDFQDNLKHLMECEYYVGGDTGMSHFAGSLDPSPRHCIYYLNRQRQHVPALPFHYQTNAKLAYF